MIPDLRASGGRWPTGGLTCWLIGWFIPLSTYGTLGGVTDQPAWIVHPVHHIVTNVNAGRATDALVLQTLADIDTGRADLNAQGAVDAATEIELGRIRCAWARAPRLAAPLIVGDGQGVAIEHVADGSTVSLVQDTEVALRAILAWVHAFLGDAAAANQEAGAATTLAHEGLPPFSRAFAWGGAMWTGFYLNDPSAARSAALITRDLSLERGFDYLATAAHVVHGWARAALGDVEGANEVDSAIAAWRHAGKAIGLPVFLVVLAKAHLLVGRASEAHAVLDEPALIRGLERELWLRPLVFNLREELAGRRL